MNGVSPTGFSNGASRSDAGKFFSQSENDVAAAFAELLKYEGVSPASEPAPTPSTTPAGSRASSSDASNSSSSAADPPSASDAPPSNSSSAESSDESTDREDEEEDRVASVAQAVSPPQQTQAPAETASEAASEEVELEAILADARTAQRELNAAGFKQAEGVSAGERPSAEFAEQSEAPASAAAAELLAAPTLKNAVESSEASALATVAVEAAALDPLRHADVRDEEPASEEGIAVEDSLHDDGLDEAALAELMAKAAATAESGKDGRFGEREARSEPDRGEKVEAAAGAEAAAQADQAAIVASVPVAENGASATNADTARGDAAEASPTAGAGVRQEMTGSLHRSIERPSETDRRQLNGPDRSRFFDRVERAFKSAEQGDGSIRMRLHPSELGSMQLTLERSENGEWIARIETENQEARQTLLEHASALKERLADQDFRLSRFEVETPADRRQQDARDFPENPQSFSRDRDRRDDEKGREDRAGESAPTNAAPGDGSRRLDVTI